MDEPTTALDVTIQAQIFELMSDLKNNNDAAILLITHDMGVVAELADNVAVMYMGNIVESGDARAVLTRPHIHIPGRCLNPYQCWKGEKAGAGTYKGFHTRPI